MRAVCWKPLAGLCLIAVPALALAGTAPPTDPAFTETAEVTAVEIPVQVVLDGKPVRGLTADNFTVYQDKKQEAVTGFATVDLYALGDDKASEVPAPARRHFLLLFDLSFSEPRSIVKARDAAAGLLDELHASDLVAVATYTASRGPELIVGFTPDRDQVRVAIATLGLPELIDRSSDPLKLVVGDLQGGVLLIRDAGRRGAGDSSSPGAQKRADATDGMREDLANRVTDRLESFARESERANIEVQKDKITALARSFTDLARLMRSVDGRKYVVYLSEGYDSSLLLGTTDKKATDESRRSEDSGEVWKVSSEQRFGDASAVNDIDAMLQEFRRADCTIQAVDIGGLRVASGGGGDLGVEHKGGRESLFQMAHDTGGDLFENFNDLSAAMGKMLERTGVTYVLTIQPEIAANDQSGDRFHPLRVELNGVPRGARVVHRPGWFAPKPFAQRSRYEKMLITAGQVLVGEEGGAVNASLLTAPMPSGFDDEADVPLVVEVDGAGLLKGQQGEDLPTEIYVYAMDAQGSVRDYIAQTLVLDMAKVEATLRQGGLKFYGHLQLPPGSYKARLLVRNGRTGEYGLKVVPLEVPPFTQAGPMLLPPFFPQPRGQWILTREAPRQGRRDVPLPFRLDDQPFLPTATPMLDDGQEARFSMLGYNLEEGDLQVRSEVQTADGRPADHGHLTLTGRQLEQTGGERLELTFKPAALQPGEYLLKVIVTDASGKAGTATTRFTVSGQPPGERS